SPLLVEDHSAVNQQAWQWVQASSAATTWLGGTPDAADHNMTVDPDYQALNLGKSPATDWFPRAYKACLDAGVAPGSSPPKKETMCTLDLLPYTNSFDSGAATVLGANHPGTSTAWATAGVAPDGTNGWWLPFGVESIGNILMWTFADTPDIAAYGLVPAQLCGDSGSNCVGPTSDSVTTALSNAKADSSGLLHVDPANPGAGGYPLVDVIYAAVPTNQSPDALNDYAKLISYAAGAGQTIGADVGDLPPGYLPLTPALQSQAQAVVTQLQGLATASPSPSSSSSASPTPAATTSSPAGQLGGNGSTTTPASTTGTGTATTGGTGTTGGGTTAAGGGTSGSGGGTGGATHPAVPAPSPGASLPAAGTHPAPTARSATAAGGPVISLPAAQPAAGTTGSTPVGIVRWVLIALIIAGGVCAVLATVLRSRFSLTWPPWSWAGSRQTRLRPPKPWSRREKPR
ncbi:MAG TPA: hypothetical protein VKU39_19735, partial [Streptosporangiaceae bacterium]|nr:hypothetical protein [Streptosporangiaceae bacterium]